MASKRYKTEQIVTLLRQIEVGGSRTASPRCKPATRRLAQPLEKNGAGDRDRTGDIQLGKLAFYR
jgi:hypothetical protein